MVELDNGNGYMVWIKSEKSTSALLFAMGRRIAKDHAPYDIWAQPGYIKTTKATSFTTDISRALSTSSERGNIKEITFDRWGVV